MTAKVRIVNVTPRLAKTWLAENTHNRSIRERQVDALVGVIQRGEWHLSNDAITFNGDGTLLNGQHRLRAVIEADAAVPMLVLRDIPQSAQDVMDLGAKRNVGDALRLRGEVDVAILAGALRQVWLYKEGFPLATNNPMPSSVQLFRVLEANPEIRRACATSHMVSSAGLSCPPTIIAALRYLFGQVDEESAAAFFSMLVLGADLEAINPVFILRKTLLHAAVRTQDRKPRRWYAAVIIKGFNAWSEGADMQVVYWRGGGLSPEPFPKINGLTPSDIEG
jgi:hypothetical protein